MRRVVRLVSVAAAALLVAGLAPGALASSPGHGPKPPQDPGRRYNQQLPEGGADVLWGLGVSNSAVNKDGLQEAMGRTFEAEGIYAPMTGSNYPTSEAEHQEQNGADIYLNINSWRLVGDKKVCYSYANYPSHVYDAYLQKWVNDLLAFNYSHTYLTFTHEPTVVKDAQPGCGSPQEYVKAYDYVFHYFRNHGVTYPFVWWMVAASFTQDYARDWQPPASDFDFVAVDGYNRFTDGNWRSPEYIFTASNDYAQSLGKPLVIGEIGSVEDPNDSQRKADWFVDAAQLIRTWDTTAILWDDAELYRPDSSPRSLAGWVSALEGAGSAFLGNAHGTPGSTADTWGAGFNANETVDVRLDGVNGRLLGSKVADGTGMIKPVVLTLPTSLAGGTHKTLAIGRTSGVVATGELDVSPATPDPFPISAGETYVFHGRGFVPGENVSVQFPGGAPESAPAGADGSVDISVVAPSEPHGGNGHLTITANSASLSVLFHPIAGTSSPSEGQPGDNVPVSVTDFGANEKINVKIDSSVFLTLTTDQWGQASGNLPLDTTFGRHTVSFVGTGSGVIRSRSILLKASLNLSPTSGPTGTVVEVTSGPGWKPGENVQVKVGAVVVDTVTADANGSVDTTVTITRKSPGDTRIYLHGLSIDQTAYGTFTVV